MSFGTPKVGSIRKLRLMVLATTRPLPLLTTKRSSRISLRAISECKGEVSNMSSSVREADLVLGMLLSVGELGGQVSSQKLERLWFETTLLRMLSEAKSMPEWKRSGGPKWRWTSMGSLGSSGLIQRGAIPILPGG